MTGKKCDQFAGKNIQPLIINRLRLVCHFYRIYHVLTAVFSFLHCVLDEISFCEVLLQCCCRSNCLEFFLDTNSNFSPVCYQRLQLLTESYLENGEEPFTVDILKEMTSKDLTMNI